MRTAASVAFRQNFERWSKYGSFYRMAGVIPEATSGKWAIVHNVKTDVSARELIRAGEYVPPGTYCTLTYGDPRTFGGSVWMSDTPMERGTNLAVLSHARGEVLIGGLGVGLIVLPILLKADVERVTVIEKSPDVIALVAPWLERARVELGAPAALDVIEADVFHWTPDQTYRFDAIYFDIWRDVDEGNLDEMKVLSSRYRTRNRAKGAWLGHWQKDHLMNLRRRGRSWNF